MSRQLSPRQDNPLIEIGRLISEETYKREKKEIYIENIVIDLVKSEGGDIIIGEVKKSSRYEKSARMQLAYYLLRLKQLGINARGELLFPREKRRVIIELNEEIESELRETERCINSIIRSNSPPLRKKIKFCNNCGYREFCWS